MTDARITVRDETPRLVTVNMADVQREEVDWLWYPRLPRGKLVFLEGDPGLGKSMLTCVIGSAISCGWPLPGQDRGEERAPQRVLLLADEDGLGDTVRPRLEALGADLTMFRAVTGIMSGAGDTPLMLDAEGVHALAAEIEEFQPVIIFIDPLFSYLGGRVDINKGNEVRAVLRPLVDLCQRTRVCMVGLRHFTKMNGVSAIYRGQGNIDFLAAARSVLAVREDPDTPGRAILCHTKSNLAEKAPALAFRIGNGAGGIEFLWEGPVDLTEDDLFAPHDEDRSAVDEAKEFLVDALFHGPKAGKEVQKDAGDAGISQRTLWRAKSKLHIRAKKQREGVWYWELPLKDDVAELADMAEFQSSSQNGKAANSANSAKGWWNDADDREEEAPF